MTVDALTGVRFGAQIESAARAHGLDPRFLAAVAAQETGGPGSSSGRNIVGDGGHGHGVFQIDDRWHAFASTPSAMDPSQNADYAAGMLSGLLKKYGGNAREALSAYNAGSPNALGTVTMWQDGTKLGYADSVLRHYAGLGGDVAALGGELAAEQPGTSAGASALAGLASAAPLNGMLQGSGSVMPMMGFQITLPTPSPYPSQFRPYSSVAGLDTNGPQQIDSQMTGLIDGAADSAASNNG
jgi:Transglycosylase SLT domain